MSHSVLDQRDFSEVITLLVLEHLLDLCVGALFFLSNKSALSNDVEAVSLLSLLHDVAAGGKFLFFESVAKLLFLIRINFSKNFDFGENTAVVFTFFGGCLLNNVVEGGPIKTVELSFSFRLDRCSSRSIVHKGEFSEEFSRFIRFKISLGAVNDFEAVEFTGANDVESVSLFSLDNDVLTRRSLHFLHGVNDDADVVLVETAEKDAFLDQIFNGLFGICVLGDDIGDKFCFLVELAKNLGAYALAAVLFLQFLFLFLLEFAEELCLFLFSF